MTAKKAPAQAYLVNNGINYPCPAGGAELRAEPGDVVDDLPADAIAALVAGGDVEKAPPGAKVTGGRKPEEAALAAVITTAIASAADASTEE